MGSARADDKGRLMSKTLDFDPDALREKYRHERDRRLRPEANDQYVEVTADFRHYIDDRQTDANDPQADITPLDPCRELHTIGWSCRGLDWP